MAADVAGHRTVFSIVAENTNKNDNSTKFMTPQSLLWYM
jgi:hypothetical protein